VKDARCRLPVTGYERVGLKFEFEGFLVIQPSICLSTEQYDCLLYEQFMVYVNIEHQLNKYGNTLGDTIQDRIITVGTKIP
jgi:hypothetical protein